MKPSSPYAFIHKAKVRKVIVTFATDAESKRLVLVDIARVVAGMVFSALVRQVIKACK